MLYFSFQSIKVIISQNIKTRTSNIFKLSHIVYLKFNKFLHFFNLRDILMYRTTAQTVFLKSICYYRKN